MIEARIEKGNSGQKAEKFVRRYLNEAPLGFIYKTFRKKDVKVNGHWVDKEYILKEGDVIRIYVSDAQLADFKKPRKAEKRNLPYPIVYEDDQVLIVDKPKGLLVYGDDKGSRETLGNAVLDYLYLKGEYDPEGNSFTPSPAHRLDRNTSGLVVYGKSVASLHALVELFRLRENIHKRYTALVVGKIEKAGEVNIPLKKNATDGRVYLSSLSEGGKTAKTIYEPIAYYPGYTLVKVDLITGRTHQIRVHMAAIGHPIVGDNKYGDFQDDRKWKAKGLESQFLHASDLFFGKLSAPLEKLSGRNLHSPLPKDLSDLLDDLLRN
ncbi:MAG: RluA family pseudouridine synthase [Bacillota bacterium]|nr:RluA family pseudouridine synthase [Bacillota bacterium]